MKFASELSRRNYWRRTYLVPIYFTHTNNVPYKEAEAALLGTTDALRASGQNRKLHNLGAAHFGQGAYASPEWYIQEARRRQSFTRSTEYGFQVSVNEIVTLFRTEPWQRTPHWEVFVVGDDITDTINQNSSQLLNFVFGSTETNFACIQSIARLRGIETPLKLAMIRRLLAHEVGHLFGLCQKGRRNTIQKLGTHCTNLCCMRQGLSLNEWAEQTRQEDVMKYGARFCRDCKNELDQTRSRYLPLP